MSKSAPITISSTVLRIRVEKQLGRPVDDDVWQRSEDYARMKIRYQREQYAQETGFDNDYLVWLTADTVRETEFSDFTIADCEIKLEHLRKVGELEGSRPAWDC